MSRKRFEIQKPDARRLRDSKPFIAKYGGKCAAEDNCEIYPGDEVHYQDDELMHVECELRPEYTGPTRICPKCNMFHVYPECPL